MSEHEEEQKVKVTDRRRFHLDDTGNVVERPDAPQRERSTSKTSSVASQHEQAQKPVTDEADPRSPSAAPSSEDAASNNKEPSREEKMATQIFLEFLNSMAHSVLVHLGETPDPGSGLIKDNLEAAQQTLEVLGVLRRKTEGNLNQQEVRMFDSLIYELMMRFRQKLEAMQQTAPQAGGG